MPFDRFYEEMISRFTRELIEKIGPERLEEIYESGEDPIGDAIPEVIEEVTDALVEALKKQIPETMASRRANFASYNKLIASYWGQAFDLLEAVIQVAYETGEDFLTSHGEQAEKEEDLVFYVLTRLQIRACRTGEEALMLMKNGYGLAAQARWRVLHEVVVVSMFIAKHGADVAERYLLHDGIESWRAIEEYQARVDRLPEYEPASDEEVSEAQRVRDELVERYGDAFASSYGWAVDALSSNPDLVSQRGFVAIEEDVGMDHLRSHYRMASHPTHANPKGILFVPDQHAANDALLAGPSIYGMADPGHAVCISLTNITATVLGSRHGMAMPFVVNAMLRLTDEAGDAFLKAGKTVDSANPDARPI